jgi:methyltransferase (TIGR00027 family)
MRDRIAATVYYIISIVLFPASLLGYVIWVGKGFLKGNPSGVSATAQGPLSARWAMHNLGSRQDEAANRLMPLLPGVPPPCQSHGELAHAAGSPRDWLRAQGLQVSLRGRCSQAVRGLSPSDLFDEAVDRYLAEMNQFVILGAGFDTRPYRLPKDTRVRSFEVDAPKTQAVKREMLAKAGIDTAGVTFVAADFEKQDWLTRLVDAGFDPRKPALFLWEGVMVYLDKDAVEATLHKIASTAKGSVVAFDYFTTEPLVSRALYWRYGRAATRAAGEPLKFGIDSTPPSRERLAELLGSCGLSLLEQRTFGQETEGKRAWGGFAIAAVK